MPNGSLERFPHFNKATNITSFSLNWERTRKVVLWLSSALTYLLEECETQIIHRDVRARNIMLDEDNNPKLGDFGLAELYERKFDTRPAGTTCYLAPEYVHTCVPTEKTDVYSFGVVLEVPTRRRPVEIDGRVLVDKGWEMLSKSKLMEVVDSRLLGRFEMREIDRMLTVGCLSRLSFCSSQATVINTSRNLEFQSLNRQLRQMCETIHMMQPQVGRNNATKLFQSLAFNISLRKDDHTHLFQCDVSGIRQKYSGKAFSNILVKQMIRAFKSLYNANLRKIICMGIGPLRCSPRALLESYNCTATHTNAEVMNQHNAMLSAGHLELNDQVFDAQIIFCDVYRGIAEIMHNPEIYGFAIVRDGCCALGRRIGKAFPARLSLAEIKSATKGFQRSKIIGEVVYEGSLASRKEVAIKRYSQASQVDPINNPFEPEVAAVVTCLKHKNLVQIIGWCCEGDELVLVSDFMPNGSLDRFLLFNKATNRTSFYLNCERTRKVSSD